MRIQDKRATKVVEQAEGREVQYDPADMTTKGKVCGEECQILIDTGSDISLISAAFGQKLGNRIRKESSTFQEIQTVNGDYARITGKTRVNLRLGTHSWKIEAHIIEGIVFDLVLGRDELEKQFKGMDFLKHTLVLKDRPHQAAVRSISEGNLGREIGILVEELDLEPNKSVKTKIEIKEGHGGKMELRGLQNLLKF